MAFTSLLFIYIFYFFYNFILIKKLLKILLIIQMQFSLWLDVNVSIINVL